MKRKLDTKNLELCEADKYSSVQVRPDTKHNVQTVSHGVPKHSYNGYRDIPLVPFLVSRVNMGSFKI